ncbi:hypothetical protein C8Q80DRAFT_1134271, partial [Daedaleopsis nitida]
MLDEAFLRLSPDVALMALLNPGSQDAASSQYIPGTLKEPFYELNDWIGSGSRAGSGATKPVCHLTGGARTGKSTVAAELCRDLRARGRLGASFFYLELQGVGYRGIYNGDLTLVLGLAYQLARFQPALTAP